MPAFDRLNRVAGKAVDRLYGEAVAITGRIVSQYGGGMADHAREAFATRGTFSDEPIAIELAGQRAGDNLPGTTRLAQGEAVIQIMAAHAAAMLWVPRKGDLAQLTERAGSPTYAVSRVDVLDHGDVVLTLAREAQS